MSTKLIVFGALFAREILRVDSPVSNIIYVPHVRPPRLPWRKCRDIFVGQHMTRHKKKATVRPLPKRLSGIGNRSAVVAVEIRPLPARTKIGFWPVMFTL